MMNRYLAFLVLLLPWLSSAAQVEFDYRNSALEAQGVRLINLYPVYVYDTNNILVTRDRITRPTLAAGTCTISNLLRGTYRAEFQGIYNVTTNWFQFPETNGTINAWLYRTNSAFGGVPTNGIFATLADLTNFIAASGVSSFNTRTGAVVLASNDVVTALGYAPGTGSGSGITNGQADINFVNLSLTNGGDSAAILVVAQEGPDQVWKWTPNELLAFHGVDRMINISSEGNIDMLGDLTASHLFGEYAGNGTNLTNLNASALASGTVPLARLSGITSNQFDAGTWLLSTNTTPGWKLTEPGYAGGTNTFEPVYTLSQGENFWLMCMTNESASGLYTFEIGETNGLVTTRVYSNAQGHTIIYIEDDLDYYFSFKNEEDNDTWPTNTAGPPGFPSPQYVVQGSLDALFYWTTNYTFVGFGVNGVTPTDGAVLAWGSGLDYTTNGGVWTIYLTNIPGGQILPGTVNSNALDAATAAQLALAGTGGTGGTGGTLTSFQGRTNAAAELLAEDVTLGKLDNLFRGSESNLVHNMQRVVAFQTNWLAHGAIGTNMPGSTKTNVLGLWLTNGFAGAEGAFLHSVGYVLCSTDWVHWRNGTTNVPVAIAVEQAIVDNGLESGQTPGITNLVIYTWSRPEFYGRTNPLFTEHLQVLSPRYDADVVNKSWSTRMIELRSRDTNKVWATRRALANVDVDGHGLNLNSQFEIVTDGNQSNCFAVNLLDAGSKLWSARSTNQAARIKSITAGAPVMVYVETNGLTGIPSVEWAGDADNAEWKLVTGVTNSYPNTTNGCYVIGFNPPPGAIVFRASVKGGKALEVFGDVQAERYSATPYTVTNANGTTWGYGAGLIRWDADYIYVSTGTNTWKRAALTTWP